MTATAAHADDPVYPGDPYDSVEVTEHSTGNPCGTVTAGPPPTGGCVALSMTIDGYTLGPNSFAECTGINLADIHIDTDGKFKVRSVGNSVCNGTATFVPCVNESTGTPYQWYGTFFRHQGTLGMHITMCVEPHPIYGQSQTFADNNIIAATSVIPGLGFGGVFVWSQFDNIHTTDWELNGDVSFD